METISREENKNNSLFKKKGSDPRDLLSEELEKFGEQNQAKKYSFLNFKGRFIY